MYNLYAIFVNKGCSTGSRNIHINIMCLHILLRKYRHFDHIILRSESYLMIMCITWAYYLYIGNVVVKFFYLITNGKPILANNVFVVVVISGYIRAPSLNTSWISMETK